ncbi:MAG TPA: AAA family ATPase, partial [Anaerolineales bacterium]|nr:AAA family ATPase [Anaerolineales bacterium]
MRIGDLSLTNFRNYRRFESRLPSGPLILVGRNAQGKTSLLEAIHYLAAANSPHAGSDRQLIHRLSPRAGPPPFMRIRAEVLLAGETRTGEVRLELQANGAGRDQRLKKTVLGDGLKRRGGGGFGAGHRGKFFPPGQGWGGGPPGGRGRPLGAAPF